MNIESQKTSLEYSKRLKELGVRQNSLYCNFINPWSKEWVVGNPNLDWEYYSAFTASELMELLPHRITLKEGEPFNSFTLVIRKSLHVKDTIDPVNIHIEYFYVIEYLYVINYECDSTHCQGEEEWIRRYLTNNITDTKFTDALAKMLIYILENGLIENG